MEQLAITGRFSEFLLLTASGIALPRLCSPCREALTVVHHMLFSQLGHFLLSTAVLHYFLPCMQPASQVFYSFLTM